jgi:hypothetical protein
MRLSYLLGTVAVVGLALAGCQTAEQSMVNAENVCLDSGLKPGTKAYARCTNASYRNNVAQSNAAATQVAVGTAAGVIGGAVVGAAAHPGYYCRGWGCW